MHEPTEDDTMEIGAVVKSGKKGTSRKGKGMNTRRVGERAHAQDPELSCRSRVLLLLPQGPHQRRVQNSYRRREGQQEQRRDKRKDKRFQQEERMSECDGRFGTTEPRNEQKQHQSRRGPRNGRRVASTHDLRGQSHPRLDRDFQQGCREL